jgi:hypothetical protein
MSLFVDHATQKVIKPAPVSNVLNLVHSPGYPLWPSFESMQHMYKIVESCIVSDLEEVFGHFVRINPYLKFWIGTIGSNPEIPLFIKQEDLTLSRGTVDHELRVSFFLNLFRKHIPYFGFAYAKIQYQGKNYLLIENIPGVIYRDLVDDKKFPLNDRIEIFCITIAIIEYARELFKLVHDDLTCNNIIVSKLPHRRNIRIGTKIYFVQYIPYIIDFDKTYTNATGGIDIPERGIKNSYEPVYDTYYFTVTVFRDEPFLFKRLLSMLGTDYKKTGTVRDNLIKYANKTKPITLQQFVQFFNQYTGFTLLDGTEENVVSPEDIFPDSHPHNNEGYPSKPPYGRFIDVI